MRSVVITGVSTGIGWATARLLLDRGFRVFGSVRKPADEATGVILVKVSDRQRLGNA
jgi:NAD(P)-dependent dehydrogenase (short-subunit alcohol dehydrogenase family)